MKETNLPVIAVNITEAARLVGVSKPTMTRWTHISGFPVVRLGGTVRIPVEGLKAWIDDQAGKGGITL